MDDQSNLELRMKQEYMRLCLNGRVVTPAVEKQIEIERVKKHGRAA